MRMILGLFLLFAAASLSSKASAQDDPRLDRLFVQLAAARTEPEIAALMGQISGIWARSGSPSLDLILERAQEAEVKGAPDVALDLYNAAVDLRPRFAEAWRRRGALHAKEGDDEEAMSDLREALRLEPRHFGALDQIGRLLEAQNDAAGAVEVYRRLLAIIPQAEGVRQRVNKLAPAAQKPEAPI